MRKNNEKNIRKELHDVWKQHNMLNIEAQVTDPLKVITNGKYVGFLTIRSGPLFSSFENAVTLLCLKKTN
jgi:hypothetical protein